MGTWHDMGQLLWHYWPVLVGNSLEWFEFAVYGYLETYMERNFFRGSALATWLGFCATFCARPLGGTALGLLSDVLGRQKAVVASGLGMLLATCGQGLLPTPRGWGEGSVPGQLGLCLLLALRLLQGLCAGGEIGAVATYVAEVAAPSSMGRCSALISVSGNMGFLLARAAVWGCQGFFSEEEMLDYGWRFPFLLALLPGLVSTCGRIFCLKESDIFEASAASESPKSRSTKRHLTEFAKMHKRSMAVGMGSVAYCAVMNYGGCVWTNSFLKKHEVQRDYLMLAGICLRLLQTVLVLGVGWLSDLYGVGSTIFAGALVQACAGLPLFMALQADPQNLTNLFVTYTIGYGVIASFASNIAIYSAELFPTSVRNLGVGLSYNLGVGLFGGFSPLLAEALLQVTPMGPGLLLSLTGIASCVVILLGLQWQRQGLLRMAHIRPRPYFGTLADGEAYKWMESDSDSE